MRSWSDVEAEAGRGKTRRRGRGYGGIESEIDGPR